MFDIIRFCCFICRHTHSTHRRISLSLLACSVNSNHTAGVMQYITELQNISHQILQHSRFTLVVSVRPRCQTFITRNVPVSHIHTKLSSQRVVVMRECETKRKRGILGTKKENKPTKAINCKSRVRSDHWMMDTGCSVLFTGVTCAVYERDEIWTRGLPWEQTDHRGVM